MLDPVDRACQITPFRRCFGGCEFIRACIKRLPIWQAGANFFHVLRIPPVLTRSGSMTTQVNHPTSLHLFHETVVHGAFPYLHLQMELTKTHCGHLPLAVPWPDLCFLAFLFTQLLRYPHKHY